MAVHFYIGGSNTGKTYKLRKTIIDMAYDDKEGSYIVIVPEQFTLETQKAYVTAHPDRGIMNIDVLSFMRLAYRVFETTGYNPPGLLDDIGKAMIVKKVMLSVRDKLSIFRGNINKPGFIDEMKSLISEFYQYNIFDDKLEEMLEVSAGKPLLMKKLSDIRLIFDAYREFISDRFVSGEELFGILTDKIEESGYIRDKVVCLDGFTGFTPSQYTLVRCLMKQAKEFYFALTIDARALNSNTAEHELFYLSHTTIQKMRKIAAELGLEEEITDVEYKACDRNPCITHIEQNIFRNHASAYVGEVEGIRITAAPGIIAEARNIVTEIERLVREENYRYRDIAVLSGATESYADILMYEFSKVGIPCFVDVKKNAMGNPLIEFIRSLFSIIIEDFSYEAVFRFLKCGLMDYATEDIEKLENYCIALGIRGHRKWSMEWTATYQSRYTIDLEQINKIRSEIYEKINSFISFNEIRKYRADSGVTVKEYMVAVYNAMGSFNVGERLQSLAQSFDNNKDINKRASAKEYEQIYREVLAVMDEIVMLLGEEVLPIKEVLTILEAGFGDIKMRLIPAGMDQVVIGDIERTRLKDIKALFFTGINDGIIPRTNQGGGILSDFERQMFSDCDIELAPTKRQSTYISEYYLYLALTKPAKKLYLSYYSVDNDGKAAIPAYLIDVISALFTGLEATYLSQTNKKEEIIDVMGTDGGLTYFIKQLKSPDTEVDELTQALYNYLKLREDIDIEKLLQVLFEIPGDSKLTKAAAQKLYGAVLTGSVTRLEGFAACAFSHFLKYGLGLEERKEYKLTAPDIGIIFHEAMSCYGTLLKENNLTWHDIDEEASGRLALKSVENAIEKVGSGIFENSRRDAYFIHKLERIVLRTIRTVENQIRQGDFEPEDFETAFSYRSEMLNLRGRIDRIDVCSKNGKDYFRVVDYKSGTKIFDLGKFYYGLQIQLLVYMSAAKRSIEEKGKTAEPAALLYYHMYDPIVEKSERVDNAILNKLIMDGLVNPAPEILSLTDRNFMGEGGLKPGIKSQVVKAATDKEGRLKANGGFADSERFDKLMKHLDNTMKDFANSIMEGDVEKNPYIYGSETACDYCIYSLICTAQGEESLRCRRLKKLKPSEIYDLIRGI